MADLDPQQLMEKLRQLDKAKSRMAWTMEPAQHAEFCQKIDAIRAEAIRGLGMIDPPPPRGSVDEHFASASQELQQSLSGEPEEMKKVRGLGAAFRALDPNALAAAPTPAAATREWRKFGVSLGGHAKSTAPETSPTVADWVFETTSLAAAAPPLQEVSATGQELLKKAIDAAQSIWQKSAAAAAEPGSTPNSPGEVDEKLKQSLLSWSQWLEASRSAGQPQPEKDRDWGDVFDK